jgi:hypothetical protein
MKGTLHHLVWSGLAVAAMSLGACIAPPVEAPKTTVEQQTDVSTEQNLKDQVDIIFMVDDSGSMAPKQALLQQKFPELIKVLDDFAASGNKASYHIGVVTSDLGAPGISCGANKGGKLQQKGAGAAASGCAGPTGANYIIYDQKTGMNNLPAGQDLPTTFNCMANVGDKGCGFESQIESVYRALHDPIAENQGFLRPDAILAVIWVTDEDDCSADPTSDLFTANPAYGNLASFRCTRFGIKCDGTFPLPATPQASFTTCEPATTADGNKLTDMTKYYNFFTQSQAKGGVKANPHDVVLAAITASPTPFGTSQGTGTDICGQGVSTCTILSHSCYLPTDMSIFGDPAVRLVSLVSKAQNNQITSICDTDYKSALQGVGNKIVSALQPSCLTAPIKDPTKPDCVVEDVTVVNGEDVHKSIPFCPNAAGAKPCWTAVQETMCPKICNPTNGCLQQFGVNIDRGGMMAPPNTTAQVSCATIAIANEDPNAACNANPSQNGCM